MLQTLSPLIFYASFRISAFCRLYPISSIYLHYSFTLKRSFFHFLFLNPLYITRVKEQPPELPFRYRSSFVHGVNAMDGGDSIVSSASKVDSARSTDACKSHKEAERRRRQRINAHLSTLRSLLPNTTKTDKASLLAEVVQHVKELRKKAADVARQDGGLWCDVGTGSEPRAWPFPDESDEASLSYCDGGEGKLVKATVCCEDRPGLNRDLARAVRSVRARVVRAEMTTVGGRTKSVVVVQLGGGGGEEDVRALKRALKAVVENRASSSGLGQLVSGNKRARVYGSISEGDYELLLTNI